MVQPFVLVLSNVTVANFTITREGNNTADWNNAGLNSAGVAIQGLSITNALIRDNIITGIGQLLTSITATVIRSAIMLLISTIPV